MRKKQKLLAVLLALTMTLALLPACGAGSAEGSASQAGAPEASTPTEAESPEVPAADAADLVLTNGVVETMIDGQEAEAVAVKGGEIVFVGTSAEAEAFIGADTQVIDLGGRMLMPGFIDAHTHDVQAIMVEKFQCFLTPLTSIEEYQAKLKEFAEANPDMEVIVGGSIDLNLFENGVPTAQWIDEIISDRPVVFTDMSLHGRCMNTKAMEVLGVTKDTPDPQGGKIYRDADGNPVGYFSDCQALVGPLSKIEYTGEQYKEAFLEYQAHANALGITDIDLGGNEIEINEAWKALSELEASGDLTLRVLATKWASSPFNAESAKADVETMNAGQQYASDFLRMTQLKVKLDGVPEGKSAFLLEPYAAGAEMPADYVSELNGDANDIAAYTAEANAAGYQVQFHAMGDAAVRTALDAVDHSVERNGQGDYRNIITHVTLITDDDKIRMGKQGTIAAMQPMWFYFDPMFSPLEEQMFGTERFQTEYHIKEMEDAGIIITGSADFPITPDAVLPAIEAGVTQCSPFPGEEDSTDYLRNPDQGVSVMNALKWYTTNGAYQMRMEDCIGTIAVGMKADLVVLGKNILTCDVKEISDVSVDYTISDGRIVFEG